MSKKEVYEFSSKELLNDDELLHSIEPGGVYEAIKDMRDKIVKAAPDAASSKDIESKFNLSLIREKELGRTTAEQEKEVAMMLPRQPMLSEAIAAYDEALDRGYLKPFDTFYKDLLDGNFKELMIDPRDYMSMMQTIPDSLKENFSEISLQDAVDGIRGGVGSLFAKHDKENAGMNA